MKNKDVLWGKNSEFRTITLKEFAGMIGIDTTNCNDDMSEKRAQKIEKGAEWPIKGFLRYKTK